MTAFFVNHSEPRERALLSAEIPFERFSIGRQRGFVVDNAYRERALTAMNSKVISESASGYAGIRVLELQRHSSRASTDADQQAPNERAHVRLAYWNKGFMAEGQDSDVFVAVAHDYLVRLGSRDIVLHCRYDGSTPTAPIHDDAFHIHF